MNERSTTHHPYCGFSNFPQRYSSCLSTLPVAPKKKSQKLGPPIISRTVLNNGQLKLVSRMIKDFRIGFKSSTPWKPKDSIIASTTFNNDDHFSVKALTGITRGTRRRTQACDYRRYLRYRNAESQRSREEQVRKGFDYRIWRFDGSSFFCRWRLLLF